uniref:Uncharacterized protein n=1 Tax=Amphimedon queenslandica TaxID=400682 RepID=A0A1X7T892_AMPQE
MILLKIISSQTTAKDYDVFPDSPNPAEHNISITAAKHLHLKVHSLRRKNLIAVSNLKLHQKKCI